MLATRVPVRSGDGTPSFILDAAEAVGRTVDVVLLAPRVDGSELRSTVGGVEVRRFAYAPQSRERLAEDAIIPRLAAEPGLWPQATSLVASMIAVAVRTHREFRPDVVHAQWILPAGLVALILRRIFGTPYVLTARGADAFVLDSSPMARIRRLVVGGADRFVAVSEEIRDRFADVRTDGVVQPSGVDVTAWERRVGTRTPEPGRLLFVGRLAAKKGVDVLIRAVAEVETARLVVVGDGPERMALERLSATLGIEGRVTFVGQADRDRVATELNRAAVMVIPSVIAADGDREGTPNVLAEAIATGVPVIASALPGISAYVEHRETGLLFEPGHIEQLQDLISESIANSAHMEELAKHAKTRFSPSLTLQAGADRYLRWYEELADRG